MSTAKVPSIMTLVEDFYPCEEAYMLYQDYHVGQEQEAWDNCVRGDHMLWLLEKFVGPPESQSHKKLMQAAVACAKLAPAIEYPEWERVRQEWLEATNDYFSNCRDTLTDIREKLSGIGRIAYYATVESRGHLSLYVANHTINAAINSINFGYDRNCNAYRAVLLASRAANDKKILKQGAIEVRKIYPKGEFNGKA